MDREFFFYTHRVYFCFNLLVGEKYYIPICTCIYIYICLFLSFLLGKGLLNRPGERLLHSQRAFKILAEYAAHYIGGFIINDTDNNSGFDNRLKIVPSLPREFIPILNEERYKNLLNWKYFFSQFIKKKNFTFVICKRFRIPVIYLLCAIPMLYLYFYWKISILLHTDIVKAEGNFTSFTGRTYK